MTCQHVSWQLAVIVGHVQLMMCALQPTPMVDVDDLTDESRCSTCACESCLKARYCTCLYDLKNQL